MAEGKSWQARIGEATDALAQDFVESITYDNRLYRQDVAGSVAHARMLAKAGLITEDEETKIVAGLKAIEEDFAAGRISLDKSLEDIHMVVEAELIDPISRTNRALMRCSAMLRRFSLRSVVLSVRPPSHSTACKGLNQRSAE